MSCKKRFIVADTFFPDRTLSDLKLFYRIDQKKRLPVRNDFHNLFCRQYGHTDASFLYLKPSLQTSY